MIEGARVRESRGVLLVGRHHVGEAHAMAVLDTSAPRGAGGRAFAAHSQTTLLALRAHETLRCG